MATTNYGLTGDETAALDAVLAGRPYSTVAASVATAQDALAGLSGDALAQAQAALDRLIARQDKLNQNAYSDVLVLRNPSVAIPDGATFDRQSIGGQDTIVVTTP